MNSTATQFFKRGATCLLASVLLSISSQAAKTLTYFSATWTFSEDCLTGVFANGEPWVVGPVTITDISPDNNSTWDNSFPGEPGPNSGSMRVTVPHTFQGFCTKMKYTLGMPHAGPYYEPVLDLSRTENLPTVLQPGEMLMTATGQPESINGVSSSVINEICILTILPEAPPAGSFRPSLFSTTPRTIQYNKSDINYTILKNHAPVPATPSQAWIEERLPALPWFEFDRSWVQTQYGPANNFAADGPLTYPNSSSVYGRNIAYKWSYVALWLNTANTQSVKEKAMIQTIQAGLDIASYLSNGGAFEAHGGHKLGRKFPLLLAAVALDEPSLLGLAADPNIFQEDKTTFFVQPSDVGRVVEHSEGTYLHEDVGLPEWGILHKDRPFHDDRRWEGGVPYRFMWPSVVGSILAADLMGQRAAWNHPAVFAYTEKFKERHGIGDGLEGQMWRRYKKSPDGSPAAPQGLKIKR